MKRFRTWTRSSYVFLRFLFFIRSIVMNITCLFRTWPYSCIWLRNIDIYGARTWAYRSWYGLRLGYHGSTKTIREAAKRRNLFGSGLFRRSRERERKHKAPENKKQGKETKNTKNKFGTPEKEKGKCPAPKKEEEQRPPQKKRKAWKEKKKKEATQLSS